MSVRGHATVVVPGDGAPEKEVWQDGEEFPCRRCYGSGEDRDGADCVYCEGFGSTLVPYFRG